MMLVAHSPPVVHLISCIYFPFWDSKLGDRASISNSNRHSASRGTFSSQDSLADIRDTLVPRARPLLPSSTEPNSSHELKIFKLRPIP